MADRVDYFADVILPLALPNLYTYRVPQAMNGEIKAGVRVVVQFGKSKLYAAIVHRVHTTAPAYTAKYIESALDAEPVVTEKQLEFWDWLAAYYLCSRGEVMLAALPTGMRLTSETKILLNEAWAGKREELNDTEFLLCEALDVRKALTLDEVSEVLNKKSVYPLIRRMLEEGVILVHEELEERYKPKRDTLLKLSAEYENEAKLKAVFDTLEKKSFRQLQALMAFVHLGEYREGKSKPVRKSQLMKVKDVESAAVSALIKKNILTAEEIEVSRLHGAEITEKEVVLSPHQEEAIDRIRKDFETKDVALLHGVTSSGKTEVYIRLIGEQLAAGKQVLYLLPEIALTTQLIVRLQKHFGEKVLVYHSRFNEHERVEVWKRVLKNEPAVVIGARSAMFLPYDPLGLVIVDEEHDHSFKQHEPAPRYNARESAMWLARLHKAKTVLGSATPSVETFYQAENGRYGLATLSERYGGAVMPVITVVDIKEALRKKMMKSHFSPELLDKTEKALASHEQVILFQNRRGFAPSIECQSCGHIPHCVRCDVSLTYHKASDQLRCHYCGWTTSPPQQCEACGSTELKMRGFGTEKIEEELALIFPSAKIARMDLDTTRGKHSLQKLVNDFEEQKVDILVGTQMVTKGLDFANVALVGILNADQLMSFPDFRAAERGYQLMAQVSGRAGRRMKQGEVIIQTFNPNQHAIQCVLAHDYHAMYRSEIEERQQFKYPPFYRLIRLDIKGKDALLLENGAKELAEKLRTHFGERILGPEFPPVSRVRDEYVENILIKIERESSPAKVKEIIAKEILDFKVHPDFKKLRVVIDVDPV